MKDGGQAFPDLIKGKDNYQLEGGMTLRDYFAGQALKGMLSNHVYFESACKYEEHKKPKIDNFVHGFLANEAYLYADALIAHKDKENG